MPFYTWSWAFLFLGVQHICRDIFPVTCHTFTNKIPKRQILHHQDAITFLKNQRELGIYTFKKCQTMWLCTFNRGIHLTRLGPSVKVRKTWRYCKCLPLSTVCSLSFKTTGRKWHLKKTDAYLMLRKLTDVFERKKNYIFNGLFMYYDFANVFEHLKAFWNKFNLSV